MGSKPKQEVNQRSTRQLTTDEEILCLGVVLEQMDNLNPFSFLMSPTVEARLETAACLLSVDLSYLRDHWDKKLRPILVDHLKLKHHFDHFWSYLIEHKISSENQIDKAQVRKDLPCLKKFKKFGIKLRKKMASIEKKENLESSLPIYKKLLTQRV